MTSRTHLLLGLTLFGFLGCQNEVTEPDPVAPQGSVTLVRDLPADTASKKEFTYFSLRDSAIVPIGDSVGSKWDLAFSGSNIRINGGTGRVGQGGAVVLKNIDFDTLSEAPESGYAVDTSGTQLAVKGWYQYTGATGTPPHTILPIAGTVIVLKTAEGKYAKAQVISYYKGNPQIGTTTPEKSRFYTFKYFLQPDGSRKLK